MATTRSRPRGREQARPSTGGTTAEHATKIYSVAAIGIVVIVAFLALTCVGHVIDAATQHFMLFYAGVFALIGLCASVGPRPGGDGPDVPEPRTPGVHPVGPPGGVLRRRDLPDHPHRHRDPRAARPRARRGGSVPVTIPHLLHRPRHDRLGSHHPARYNGHYARSVQRERKSVALAGDSLHVLRLASSSASGTACLAAAQASPTWTGATGSSSRSCCSASRCGC